MHTQYFAATRVSSDLAAFSINPFRQRLEDKLKPMLSRDFGMNLNGFE
jgi:hypothetical protein